jgi:hypothetical protein
MMYVANCVVFVLIHVSQTYAKPIYLYAQPSIPLPIRCDPLLAACMGFDIEISFRKDYRKIMEWLSLFRRIMCSFRVIRSVLEKLVSQFGTEPNTKRKSAKK